MPGKQKAIAKLRKAHLVVLVNDTPKKLMENPTFENQIMVSTAKKDAMYYGYTPTCNVNLDLMISSYLLALFPCRLYVQRKKNKFLLVLNVV